VSPFRPRPLRFVRDPDGRIIDVRPAADDFFTVGDWMHDREVQLWFAELDARAGRIRLREFDPLAHDGPERSVSERHERALARSRGRRRP
jgi:PAS domain-containing protein